MLVGTAIAAAALWVAPASVRACSCAESTDREHLDNASVVFVGTVVDEWSQPPPESGEYSSDLPRWFTFGVTEVHKGDAFEAQSIRTSVDGAACGMELAGRGPYLIFAVGETDLSRPGAGEYRSGLCAGNRSLGAAPIPGDFGPARPPLPGASVSTRPADGAASGTATTPTTTPTTTTTTTTGAAPTTVPDTAGEDGNEDLRPFLVMALLALVVAAVGTFVVFGIVPAVRRHQRLRHTA